MRLIIFAFFLTRTITKVSLRVKISISSYERILAIVWRNLKYESLYFVHFLCSHPLDYIQNNYLSSLRLHTCNKSFSGSIAAKQTNVKFLFNRINTNLLRKIRLKNHWFFKVFCFRKACNCKWWFVLKIKYGH